MLRQVYERFYIRYGKEVCSAPFYIVKAIDESLEEPANDPEYSMPTR